MKIIGKPKFGKLIGSVAVGALALSSGGVTAPVVPWVPLVSTNWRQPLLAGFDSSGTITAALGISSTNKTLPLASVAISGTTAITVTSAGVVNGSPTVTAIAALHGKSVGDYITVSGTTTVPAAGANGLFKIVTVPDVNTFTYTGNSGVNFTTTNAAIGGTFLSCNGTARDFSVKFDTVPAEGSFLYFDINGAIGWRITYHESSDSADGSAGSGTWTTNAFTPFSLPATDPTTGPQTNAVNRGQVIPFTTSGWKRIHIINFDTAATADVLIGAFKQKSATILPDLGMNVGSSITAGDCPPRILRQRTYTLRSTRDAIYINVGQFGAKVGDMLTLLTTWQTFGVTPGYITVQPGPNNTSPNRPYSTDPSQALVATQMQSLLDFMHSSWGASLPIFCANMGHFNPTAAPAVNDLANPENGCEPYDSNQCEPKIRDAYPVYNWNTTYARPIIDELLGFAQVPPGTLALPGFYADGTTHPKSWGYDYTQQIVDYADAYLMTGIIGDPYCLTVVASAELHGVPAYYKTRLQTIYGGTILSGSLAALLTRVNALSTVYSEPAGTKPTDMATQPLAWYDPAKFDTITLTTTNGLISQVNDRGPNAYHLPQATDAKKPIYIANRRLGLGYIGAANASKLGGTAAPAALFGAFDAASMPFMVFVAICSGGSGTAGTIMGIGQGAANKFLFGVTGTDALGLGTSGAMRILAATTGLPNGTGLITGASGLNNGVETWKWKVFSALYDGTTLTMRRNGVTDGTPAAWTKPAWTGDSFTWMCNGPDNTRYSGLSGDMVLRSDYNLMDAGTIETYLMNKWGAS